MMKRSIILLLALAGSTPVLSQPLQTTDHGYTIGLHYTRDFVLGGSVRVREWDLEGDNVKLKDLGMTSYAAFQFNVERSLKGRKSIALTYDQFLVRGSAVFDHDVAYNGTLVDGRNGIDVSPTDYFRITFRYRDALLDKEYIQLGYILGLVFDHITFYLDGEVRPWSPRNEVYERFGKQALPYPVAGMSGKVNLRKNDHLSLQVYGTYIPEFRSFFNEGGPMDLQYSTFESDLRYTKQIAYWQLVAGTRFRYMHLFQESAEDTNEITTVTAGPYIGVAFKF